MLKVKQDIGYYFFALSNFIAALGGGMILGKGVGVIDNPFLQESSVLAFFVGTILGLIFLQLVPKKQSKYIARWFSICAAGISLILFSIFQSYSIEGKLTDIAAFLFFVLLSIRFGFWFYSRVLRASLAAGQQQRIAWVELGYYSGMICGLVVWSFLGIQLGIAAALIIDACLQFSAGAIDLYVGQRTPRQQITESQKAANKTVFQKNGGWPLAYSIVFLTIGIQVVIFTLAHQVSAYFTSYILAFYYIGVSIAAFLCKKFKIHLEWSPITRKKISYARIFSDAGMNKQGISFIINGLLSAICAGIATLGVIYWQWGTKIETNKVMFGINEILLLIFIVASAFFYEILALAILDRIGLEERSSNHQGMVMYTYGLMGVGAAISLWILGISNSSAFGLLFTTSICIIFSIFFIRRKTQLYNNFKNI